MDHTYDEEEFFFFFFTPMVYEEKEGKEREIYISTLVSMKSLDELSTSLFPSLFPRTENRNRVYRKYIYLRFVYIRPREGREIVDGTKIETNAEASIFGPALSCLLLDCVYIGFGNVSSL